jgi:hypothetical protein
MVVNLTENAKNSGLDFQLGKAILAIHTRHTDCYILQKTWSGDELKELLLRLI